MGLVSYAASESCRVFKVGPYLPSTRNVSDRLYVGHSHFTCIVPKVLSNVGQHFSDVLIAQEAVLGHDALIGDAAHINRALQAVQDYSDQSVLSPCYPISPGKGWKPSGGTPSILLVTGAAVGPISGLPGKLRIALKIVVNKMGSSQIGFGLPVSHPSQLLVPELAPVSLEHDSPDLALFRITDIQRPIRTHRYTGRPIRRITDAHNWIRSGKSIGKNFPLSGNPTVFKGDKGNEVPGLRIWGTDSGTMKRDESTISVPLGKLASLVEHHVIGGPMSGEADLRCIELLASAYLIAISTVFRCQDLPSLNLIVVTIGPSEIRTVPDS